MYLDTQARANSVDPDQMHSMASDQGLQYFITYPVGF